MIRQEHIKWVCKGCKECRDLNAGVLTQIFLTRLYGASIVNGQLCDLATMYLNHIK